MGKSQNVQAIGQILDAHNFTYNFDEKDLYMLKDAHMLTEKNHNIQRATISDVDEIFDFLQSIPQLKSLYTSKDMIEDRIAKNLGIHYIIRSQGKIVAHGNSAAESQLTTMIGGVGTAKEHRENGLATEIVNALAKDIIKNGKSPCLFTARTDGSNLFEKMGFEKVGQWGTITNIELSN
jgi:predicted GNAT family acetyltransferase